MLQMSKSLIEGGGVGIHIYTHYNGIYTLHNSGSKIILYNALMYCTVACLLSLSHTIFLILL